MVLLFVLVPLLLLILWGANRWVLKGKFKLIYRILLSICIPFVLICFIFLYTYYAPYSTSDMNERLERLVPEIKLPPYKITKYSSIYLEGDDLKDTYQMVFKDASIKSIIPKLDSLCSTNEKWTKRGNEYVFNTFDYEKEFNDSLIVRPNNGTATFVRYMW